MTVTMASIVTIVVTPNSAVTNTTPHTLPVAAGYINIGINGSQGPKRKMVNRTQGVMARRSAAALRSCLDERSGEA
jgi:hypothetical protein